MQRLLLFDFVETLLQLLMEVQTTKARLLPDTGPGCVTFVHSKDGPEGLNVFSYEPVLLAKLQDPISYMLLQLFNLVFLDRQILEAVSKSFIIDQTEERVCQPTVRHRRTERWSHAAKSKSDSRACFTRGPFDVP